MGFNYYRRPARADLDPPNDFITESMGDEYGQNGELAHWADGHTTMAFVDRQLDRADARQRGLFGYGSN